MRPIESERPKNIYSRNLWKLYVFLNSLEKSYIYAGWDKKSPHGEEMYYIENMTLEGEETFYAHYSIGDIPCSKKEWITLKVVNIESGHLNRIAHTIETEALYEQNRSIEELLEKYGIRIPSDEALKNRSYKDIISPEGDYVMPVPEYF